MELRQLITFRMVASTLNFSRAAAALNYVPSNITLQIQALEGELGVRLFDRLGKQVVLTDAGKQFLFHVDRVLNNIEEARLSVSDNHDMTGTVTIGANEMHCAYRLPKVLQLYRKRCPDVQLIFRPTPNEDLKQSLYDGRNDVVFILDQPMNSSGLLIELLIEEPFRLYAEPNHPLTKKSEIHLEDLRGELLLLNEKGCTYRTFFDQALVREGIDRLHMNLEFSSAEAIKQCAISGIGIAFLPQLAVSGELERGELVVLPWEMSELRVATQMAWHREKWISPAILAFLNVARESLSRISC
ncbi:LysR family transcriptional regulator [Paenibacillus nasutitermitis]|uniref:LysR family transcriptional regulator n=1 Tax=Paenibacillus nasutitermitis TaxID=1652958 RepID=A0A916YV37_9BACL|nr:LysR family transcriptional regulator [Paenibacillus nasutitermitis]GGD62502.1 LysR family transcriptional regulator [Paenibacillus nasutitermitis]